MAEPTAQQVAALKKRVIRADRALNCCRSAERRQWATTLGIINKVIELSISFAEDQNLALLPLGVGAAGLVGTVTTRLVAVAAGAPLVTGALVIASGVEIVGVARQSGALAAIDLFSRIVGQTIATEPTSCYDCIVRQVLPQNHPRKRERTKILRRV